ncbi:hypothetical protein PPL_09900 [Heterostelium album PN500]|uniref:ubiquitinyl hydrolase 1 n=1 Tax=Heterostelium pallidum (strain ATCC 26659 / Pp 5 / PN500) TaxID=670386 RepID=D3BPD5_HETP5|nr:hypothetical protein PPL_09900 [Heterostelium album PN500]EFA77145.1 hypothetical protein PPL_09900 [Heterostelium album PN500]|eukprot:XP_020429274.1 hypothetical protein PPL_09900 [Heterostelium album PN500]
MNNNNNINNNNNVIVVNNNLICKLNEVGLTHLFMGSKLFGKWGEADVKAELEIIQLFQKFLEQPLARNFNIKIKSSQLSDVVADLVQCVVSPHSEAMLLQLLQERLQPDAERSKPLALYISNLNCILLFYMQSAEKARIDVIKIYPDWNEYTAKTTKLRIATPLQSFSVPAKSLLDTNFLHYLTVLRDNYDLSLRYRNIWNSEFINEEGRLGLLTSWLLPSLAGCESVRVVEYLIHSQHQPTIIYKSIRPEQIITKETSTTAPVKGNTPNTASPVRGNTPRVSVNTHKRSTPSKARSPFLLAPREEPDVADYREMEDCHTIEEITKQYEIRRLLRNQRREQAADDDDDGDGGDIIGDGLALPNKIGGDILKPWKRSPLWVGLKSLMHYLFVHFLEVAQDRKYSTVIYKSMMTTFYSLVLSKSKLSSRHSEWFPKLIHRCEKLQELCDVTKRELEVDTLPVQIMLMLKSTVDLTNTTVQAISEQLQSNWQNYCATQETESDISATITSVVDGLSDTGNLSTVFDFQPLMEFPFENLEQSTSATKQKGSMAELKEEPLPIKMSGTILTTIEELNERVAKFKSREYHRLLLADQLEEYPYVELKTLSNIFVTNGVEYRALRSVEQHFSTRIRNAKHENIFDLSENGLAYRWAAKHMIQKHKVWLQKVTTQNQEAIASFRAIKLAHKAELDKLQAELAKHTPENVRTKDQIMRDHKKLENRATPTHVNLLPKEKTLERVIVFEDNVPPEIKVVRTAYALLNQAIQKSVKESHHHHSSYASSDLRLSRFITGQVSKMIRLVTEETFLSFSRTYNTVDYKQPIREFVDISAGSVSTRIDREVFDQPTFVEFACDIVSSYLPTLNVEDQYSLLFIIQFLIMMFNSTKNAVLRTLLKTNIMQCRKIGVKWLDEISEHLSRLMLTDNQNESAIDLYIQKLLFSAISIIFTYDQMPFTKKLRSHQLFSLESSLKMDANDIPNNDLFILIRANSILSENSGIASKMPDTSLSKYLMFQSYVISFRLASRMRKYVGRQPQLLSMFLCSYWRLPMEHMNQFSQWTHTPETNFYSCTFQEETSIQLNILDGRVLVNGDPNHQLPSSIQLNESYKSVFGKLKFTVNSIGKNRCICGNQYFGTLIGLSNYLLLEDKKTNEKILFVPHSKLMLESVAKTEYHTCKPDLEHLQHPPYFRYQINHELKVLGPQEISSNLFLAYLHLMTSTANTDPFLGQTGFEMAITLLQRFQTNRLFTPQSLNILNLIKTISPTRNPYRRKKATANENNSTIQDVSYHHPLLSGVACHDLTLLLVNKILSQNQECKFLYDTNEQSQTTINIYENAINIASCWRNRRVLSYQITADLFISIVPETFIVANEVVIGIRTPTERSAYTYRVSEFLSNPAAKLNKLDLSFNPSCVSSNRMNFFNGEKQSLENILELDELSFSTHYISLYQLAKSIRKNTDHKSKLALLLSFMNLLSSKPVENHKLFDHIIYLATLAPELDAELEKCQEPDLRQFSNPWVTYDSSYIKNIIAPTVGSRVASKKKEEPDQLFQNIEKLKLWQEMWVSDEKTIIGKAPNLQFIRSITFKGYANDFIVQLTRQYNEWRHNYRLLLFLRNISRITYMPNNNVSAPADVYPAIRDNTPGIDNIIRYTYDWKTMVNWRDSQTIRHINIDTRWSNMFNLGYDMNFEDEFMACLVEKDAHFPFAEEINLLFEDHEETTKIGADYHDALENSKEHLRTQIESTPLYELADIQLVQDILSKMYHEINEAKGLIWAFIESFYNSNWKKRSAFIKCGLWKKCIPVNVYKDFIDFKYKSNVDQTKIPLKLFELIGIHILLVTYLQKVERAITESTDRDALVKILSQSRKTRKWSVTDHPHWALFELERNIWIYDIQVEIAMVLLNSTENNRCIQLQMGQGKTSVIIPIMCLALKDRIARINVLPSLLETSIEDMLLTMGSSIFNRPIHIYPFRRDIVSQLNSSQLQRILGNLELCKAKQGIIISTPDHWLSFKLSGKLLNKSKNQISAIIQWSNNNLFNILDECDELLSTKYQLIFPYGNKTNLDECKDRCTTFQDIFLTLKELIGKLDFAASDIEIIHKDRPSVFPMITIHNEEAGMRLMQSLLDQLLLKFIYRSPRIRDMLPVFCGYTTADNIGTDALKNNPRYTVLLIYRALFKYGILQHCLSKIWSKDYGSRSSSDSLIHTTGKRKAVKGGFFTQLAVPYRAKDVPAERAVLSHPDAVLGFTHLTYYHQGLSLSQFRDALTRLISVCNQQKFEVYNSWIQFDSTIPVEFHSLNSVVLSNDIFINDLYQHLKYNMLVIHFWLNELVFPFETKQHPKKIFASSWDIVTGNHIAGFSGTNDTSILFPLSIKQEDLPSLLYTNTEVFNYILNQEDNQVHFIPQNCNILDHVTKTDTFARVFIDSGALMIGMTNFQVAKSFLEKTDPSKADAVLYFENGNLISMDRDDKKLLFHQSPYAKRLNRVIVYLDDYHTRGVDIKFEKDTHAIVTVGPRMTKDKLMQACMRMRKLGFGQTVSFMVPDHLGIGENVIDIFRWTINNTIRGIEKSLHIWMTQGLHFYRSHCASVLQNSEPFEKEFLQLSSLPETTTLKAMYEPSFIKQDIKVVANHLKIAMVTSFKQDIDSIREMDKVIAKAAKSGNKKMSNQLENRIKDIGDNISIFSSTNQDGEEERENELEEEKEDESLTENIVSYEPTFELTLKLVVKGESPFLMVPTSEGNENYLSIARRISSVGNERKFCKQPFLPVSAIYINTPIGSLLTRNGKIINVFDSNILTTLDFVRVHEPNRSIKNTMEFCRLINYVLVLWEPTPVFILLSQHEASKVYSLIQADLRSNRVVKVSLHQTRPHILPNQREYMEAIHTPLPPGASFDSIKHLIVQLNIINGSKYFNDNLDATIKFLGLSIRNNNNNNNNDKKDDNNNDIENNNDNIDGNNNNNNEIDGNKYNDNEIDGYNDIENNNDNIDGNNNNDIDCNKNDGQPVVKKELDEKVKFETDPNVDHDGFLKNEKTRFNDKPLQFLELNYTFNRVSTVFGSDMEKIVPNISIK